MARKRISKPQYAEHIRYGRGEIRAVRELDGLVADVQFARIVRLRSPKPE